MKINIYSYIYINHWCGCESLILECKNAYIQQFNNHFNSMTVMWSTEIFSCNNLYNHGKQGTITREVDQLPIPKISVVVAVVMYLLTSFNREQECQTVVLKQDRSVHIDIALCLCGSLIFRLFGRVCPKQVHVHVVFGLF